MSESKEVQRAQRVETRRKVLRILTRVAVIREVAIIKGIRRSAQHIGNSNSYQYILR